VASTNSALFSAPSRSSSLSSFAKENDARLTHHFSPRHHGDGQVTHRLLKCRWPRRGSALARTP
jgi:hypothetical protein